MRKIEIELLDAIKAKRNWSKSNSSCKFYSNNCYVYLHNNNIAVIDFTDDNITEIRLYSQRYLTKTTKSRFNVVLTLVTKRTGNVLTNYRIYSKNSIWYLSCTSYDAITQEVTTVFNKEFEEGISIKL